MSAKIFSFPVPLSPWFTASLQAALAGEGLAYLSDFATADHVASGRLERVLEDWSPPFPGLRLYYPSSRNVPTKLRAFIELIRERAR